MTVRYVVLQSSVTAYKRRMTVSYVVLQVISHSIRTSHDGKAHGIQQQQYADDTQLYVALSPNSMVAHVSALESCLESLQAWFCANSMTLNPDKSNAILFATTQRAQSLPNQVSVNISGVTIPLSSHVKILGVVLDPRITLSV